MGTTQCGCEERRSTPSRHRPIANASVYHNLSAPIESTEPHLLGDAHEAGAGRHQLPRFELRAGLERQARRRPQKVPVARPLPAQGPGDGGRFGVPADADSAWVGWGVVR